MTETPAPRSMRDLADKRSDVFHLRVEHINEKEGFNTRNWDLEINRQELEKLALNIKANGVCNPLQGYFDASDKRFYLVDGHRRLRAVLLLRERGTIIETLPCTQGGKYDTEDDRLMKPLVLGTGSKPPEPIEMCERLKLMIKRGWDEQRLATHLGMSVAAIKNALLLSTATEATKEAVNRGEVAATTVVAALRETKDAAAVEAQVAQAVTAAKAAGKGKATRSSVAKAKPTTIALEMVVGQVHALLTGIAESKSLEECKTFAREGLEIINKNC